MLSVWLLFAGLLVTAKVASYAFAVVTLTLRGADLARHLRLKETGVEYKHFPSLLSPIDRVVQSWPRAARVAFTTPAVVTIGAVIVFASASPAGRLLTILVGGLVAATAMLALVTAVLRRLVLGQEDVLTSDVQIPAVGVLKDWAVAREAGANASLYFLVLVYLSLIGFAALYFALEVVSPGAFTGASNPDSVVTWLYFSLTTLGTVGFGDIHPETAAAQGPSERKSRRDRCCFPGC